MSVLVCDRQESKFEPIVYAEDLRMELKDYMVRNFGIKTRYMERLMSIDTHDTYKVYLKDHKQKVDGILAKISSLVRGANSIYPREKSEYDLRRQYQAAAISNCEMLVNEIQSIIVYFKKIEHEIAGFRIDANAAKRSIKAVSKEMELIKKWRQKDNRFLSIFR